MLSTVPDYLRDFGNFECVTSGIFNDAGHVKRLRHELATRVRVRCVCPEMAPPCPDGANTQSSNGLREGACVDLSASQFETILAADVGERCNVRLFRRRFT